MVKWFHLGGWGMWPTLVCGLFLLGAAIGFAARPEKRLLPLLISLGLMTLISGLLGFATGLTHSLEYLDRVTPDQRYIWLIGLGESLYNVNFALVFLMLAVIAATVGAWRFTRAQPG
jgi:hypothetical protein